MSAWFDLDDEKERSRALAYLAKGILNPRRSNDQNKRLWAMLTEVSRQVDWYGQKLAPEDWKHIFSSSLKKQRVVPGLDDGFVVLGISTSKLSVSEFAELIELIQAFGVEHDVVFSDEAEHASQE